MNVYEDGVQCSSLHDWKILLLLSGAQQHYVPPRPSYYGNKDADGNFGSHWLPAKSGLPVCPTLTDRPSIFRGKSPILSSRSYASQPQFKLNGIWFPGRIKNGTDDGSFGRSKHDVLHEKLLLLSKLISYVDLAKSNKN
jgi:hypothetical protein